ncbi:MAG: MATE family efflux transporter, partial [Spirochaetaceae bacterium]|nr:MATE family efflux transporter [Spirochaetaceae bacterium]
MTKSMTEGSPIRLIVSFTIPLLIGQVFQQLYNAADTFIVGRTIGVTALAAVGSTGSFVFLLVGFVLGFTNGLSIVTAQRFGAQDEQGVRKSVAVSAVLSVLLAVVLTLFAVFAGRPILVLLRTPPEILDDAWRYAVIIFGGIGITIIFNLLSYLIMAVGDSRTPLYFLIIASVINIALDYVFILIFKMGVRGAAVATIIAQCISVLLCMLFIIKRIPVLRTSRQDWKIALDDAAAHLKIALPMGFQMCIIGIGGLLIQAALNGLGTIAVAGFTTGVKLEQFAVMPLACFGVAMAAYTAQNYGAGKYQRIKTGLFQCSLLSVAISIVVGCIYVFAGQYPAALFVGASPEAVSFTHTYLIYTGSCYSILALLFIFRYTLQGLGNSLFP